MLQKTVAEYNVCNLISHFKNMDKRNYKKGTIPPKKSTSMHSIT